MYRPGTWPSRNEEQCIGPYNSVVDNIAYSWSSYIRPYLLRIRQAHKFSIRAPVILLGRLGVAEVASRVHLSPLSDAGRGALTISPAPDFWPLDPDEQLSTTTLTPFRTPELLLNLSLYTISNHGEYIPFRPRQELLEAAGQSVCNGLGLLVTIVCDSKRQEQQHHGRKCPSQWHKACHAPLGSLPSLQALQWHITQACNVNSANMSFTVCTTPYLPRQHGLFRFHDGASGIPQAPRWPRDRHAKEGSS